MHLDKEPGKLYSVHTKGGRIQTAHGATIMPVETTHLCYKTYFDKDRLGEIRPIIVKAYVVPGLKYDLLSVKELYQGHGTAR